MPEACPVVASAGVRTAFPALSQLSLPSPGVFGPCGALFHANLGTPWLFPSILLRGTVKAGKSKCLSLIFWNDTGLAMNLAGLQEPTGAHLENIIHHDLAAWRDARIDHTEILYWRTTTGEEVDFVVETEGRLIPIEVKSTDRPRLRDATHLRSFQAEYGDKARAGLLLHTGTSVEWLTADVLAVPWWMVV